MRTRTAVLVIGLAALAVVLASRPVAAAPCAGFTDVEDTSAFCPNVSWLRNRNITFGCSATLYCPNDPVTRLQMAAFMNRLGDALFPLTCAAGQVMKWNGAAWTCSDDNIGGSGGGGTVTSVLAGTGLQASPNPIVGAGSINLAPSYQLPQACANGQVPKSNGTGGWTCGADNAGTGTVTSVSAGTGLTGGTITSAGTLAVDTSAIQARVTGTCAAGSSIRAIAANGTVTCEVDDGGAANAFAQGGNAFGAAAVLGTTDNNALDIRVNASRVMRYEPNAVSPNVIGGSPANSVTAGVRGATIAGGGVPTGDTDPNFTNEGPNRVTDAYGTVGGGYGNRAGNDAGTTTDAPSPTVGGGRENTASGDYSTVGGGARNTASGVDSTVGGGLQNTASGSDSTVGGGSNNIASAFRSTVGGGDANLASGHASTVGGGYNNIASGDYSVAMGRDNLAQGDYSIALGNRAKNLGAGSFQFADSQPFDYATAGVNNFRVRATGGVRFTTGIDAAGNTTYSCVTTDGNAWSCSSDRNLKQNLVELDGEAVLAKVAAMPVYQWQPKGANAHMKHYGPMAQDFHAAFGLGDDDKMIGMQDADGVALAAIQGLNAKLEAKIAAQAREIAAERAARDAQAKEIAELRQMLARLLASR